MAEITPELAADNAQNILAIAEHADNDRAAALVAVADGWTRLHTALANAPKTIEPAPTVVMTYAPKPEPAERSVPVDWQAIVKQRDRELKTVGERKYVAEQELAKMRDAYKDALARMTKVEEVRDIAGQPGNWDVDEYQRGYYNGLELAVSILEGDRDPVFRDAPASGYRTPKRASDPDPPTVKFNP